MTDLTDFFTNAKCQISDVFLIAAIIIKTLKTTSFWELLKK